MSGSRPGGSQVLVEDGAVLEQSVSGQANMVSTRIEPPSNWASWSPTTASTVGTAFLTTCANTRGGSLWHTGSGRTLACAPWHRCRIAAMTPAGITMYRRQDQRAQARPVEGEVAGPATADPGRGRTPRLTAKMTTKTISARRGSIRRDGNGRNGAVRQEPAVYRQQCRARSRREPNRRPLPRSWRSRRRQHLTEDRAAGRDRHAEIACYHMAQPLQVLERHWWSQR